MKKKFSTYLYISIYIYIHFQKIGAENLNSNNKKNSLRTKTKKNRKK